MFLLILQRPNASQLTLPNTIAEFQVRPQLWDIAAGESHVARVVPYSAKLERALNGELPTQVAGLSPMAAMNGPPWSVFRMMKHDDEAIAATLASVGLMKHVED